MSEKSKKESRRREFNIETERNALPLLWAFSIAGFVAGLLMVAAGLIWNLSAFVSGGPLIMVGSGIILFITWKGRQQVKKLDAQKNLERPSESGE